MGPQTLGPASDIRKRQQGDQRVVTSSDLGTQPQEAQLGREGRLQVQSHPCRSPERHTGESLPKAFRPGQPWDCGGQKQVAESYAQSGPQSSSGTLSPLRHPRWGRTGGCLLPPAAAAVTHSVLSVPHPPPTPRPGTCRRHSGRSSHLVSPEEGGLLQSVAELLQAGHVLSLCVEGGTVVSRLPQCSERHPARMGQQGGGTAVW